MKYLYPKATVIKFVPKRNCMSLKFIINRYKEKAVIQNIPLLVVSRLLSGMVNRNWT